ncbi:flagellar M-ring protein FliF [Cellulosimicrobium cellulans]|uniref:flagellar basal-body MS-ring/collar protein FliF n=1 Tax=Cellulosimicrobium TaxID=157920 RepID=UPI0008872320|nr:flagellar basal-body MS-ring/collar protein FliF [Sphaerisporangium cinnabarinum]MCR1984296.1 flagellar M-ring protein FliF [Cellulosimicrobium cellulans]PTU56386.1 flagellar M-ring protein FliF [Sphaerisporangium cinnabarinum]SDF79311.1 flagellar M-ring protein FliF [Cellulosimicrobium cellulans]
MPEKIRSTFGRAFGAVRDFTIAQRTLALLALAILVVAIVALVSWASRPSYTPLFSGMSSADAAAIVDQLRSQGVPYELTDGGGTVLVPEEKVYEQRLAAATAGLPADESTGGYSLLDEMGVTSSEFQQDVTYKRALEGELARTLSAMDGVETATVQLAIPEETVFAAEQGTPTASVFVAPARGQKLTTEQVEAMVHLVSASIDGMAPTDVAVVDAQGEVLSEVGVGARSSGEQAGQYEEKVSGQVQAMLDRVVGAGNSTVAVTAQMDVASSERLEETFRTPEGGPVLNESTTTEEYTGAGGGVAGVLGPDNIAVPGGAGADSSYTSEDATRNNAIDKVTETTTTPAGALTRQAVSVALDAEVARGMDTAAITAMVSAAAGIDAERGDTVEVAVLPFDTGAAESAQAALAAAEEAAAAESRAQMLRTAAVVAGVLIALVIVLVAVRRARRRRERRETVDLDDLRMTTLHELDRDDDRPALPSGGGQGELEPVPERPEIQPPTPRFTSLDQRRAEIDALAATDPDKTAEYLRVLLAEDRAGAQR